MAIFRRPVSQRRKASCPYKARGPASKSSRSTFKRIDTNKGTNPAHMVVHRGIGLPDKFRTRLIWNQAVVLTGFSSAHQSYAVRLNGPYDPQVALGGSQPQYYDMLASMYSTYMVRVQRFLVHLVLRPAVLLAMGLMWLVSSVVVLLHL